MSLSDIEVRLLTNELIKSLDSYLRKDPIANFYPIYDLYDVESRKRSTYYAGLKDGDVIGFLLIYQAEYFPFINVGGSEFAALRLMDVLNVEKAIFHVDPEFSDITKRKFRITSEYVTEIMYLKRGEEKLHVEHDVELLSDFHALELLKLMRQRRPSPITDEDVKRAADYLRRYETYGIFVDERLVSIARLYKLLLHIPEVCSVGMVFTDPDYRGRGFATSLVSKCVESAFRNDSVKYVALTVNRDNISAKRVYEKIGFKKYKDRCWLNLNVDYPP